MVRGGLRVLVGDAIVGGGGNAVRYVPIYTLLQSSVSSAKVFLILNAVAQLFPNSASKVQRSRRSPRGPINKFPR